MAGLTLSATSVCKWLPKITLIKLRKSPSQSVQNVSIVCAPSIRYLSNCDSAKKRVHFEWFFEGRANCDVINSRRDGFTEMSTCVVISDFLQENDVKIYRPENIRRCRDPLCW